MKNLNILSVDFALIHAKAWNFLAWWAGELSDLIPAAWKQLLFKPNSVLVLKAKDAGSVLAFHEKGAQGRPFESKNGTRIFDCIEVSLNPDHVFSVDAFYPAAQANNLDDILPMQVARYFPLKTEEIHFCYQTEKARDPDQIKVTLFVIRKQDIHPVFAFLEKKKIYARTIRFQASKQSGAACFNLRPARTAPFGFSLQALLRRPAVAATALWVVMFLGYGLYLSIHEARLAAKVENLQASISQTTEIISAFEKNASTERALADIAASTSTLAVLDELSRILPMDAWVDDFSLQDGKIVLNGFHDDPPLVLKILENSTYFTDGALPSVNEPRNGEQNSRFQITLGLSGEGEDRS